ncbi:DNA-binding protein [Ramlibacter terrae]|uniref:DNA-binding protein n=1 Tax=Ramlibacter terrae TaxID=2732511 RepID=A0ABX6P939_9BURK|nr:DNA-binding protein [Ramlibacter terrae]
MVQWRDYLRAGRLMLQRCADCARYLFYPRVLCPHCSGVALTREPANGSGIVYSTSTVARRAEQGGDYNVSLVDLDEGVRMMTRVDGIPSKDVRIGMRVRAGIVQEGAEHLLVFRPAQEGM